MLDRSATRARLGAGIAAGMILCWSALATAQVTAEGFANLVEKVSPAVVTVLVTERASPEASGFGGPSPFDEFFRRFGIPMPGPEGQGPDQPMHGLGSGFVIGRDGYIVTNNHVVEGAESVEVRLADERELDAKIIGTDPLTDLALLKVEADEKLPLVTFADSDKLRVGDIVLAVGNPFGLGGTVTAGIVSALGRDLDAGPYVDFIQTDAAINRGNSGGPLFDTRGAVVGVTSQILSPSGGSIGVGFAIPANLVKTVVAQLEKSGTVERGWLGVSIQRVTPGIAAAMGNEELHGALVAAVDPNGPSAAVLEQGDVITSFAGKEVATSRDLPKLVAATPVGARATIGIIRNGKRREVAVTIGQLPKQQAMAMVTGGEAPEQSLGMVLKPLTPEVRQALGLPADVQGALVAELDPAGQAAQAGIEPGDVIERVGDAAIAGPADVQRALRGTATRTALLLVNRRGNEIFVAVNRALG
jgi:serine protease Do